MRKPDSVTFEKRASLISALLIYKLDFGTDDKPYYRLTCLPNPKAANSLPLPLLEKLCKCFPTICGERDLNPNRYVPPGSSTSSVPTEIAEYVKGRFFEPATKLPDRYFRFWCFVDEEQSETPFPVCFDFYNLRSIELKSADALGWRRICRLDSPYIEEMLQKFGSHSFRLGAPEWDYGETTK